MSAIDADRQRITIAIAAMGGQGGGVLGDWIVGIAEANGYYAQSTSVPGVAQRTGATIYYIELFPDEASRAQPVLALMPVPGDVDIVIASELVEAGRAVQRGIVTRDRTTLIASNHRAFAYIEKSAMGDGRIDAAQLEDSLQATARQFVCFDMQALAEQHGTVISATLFGALAGAGVLPFSRDAFEMAIRETGKAVNANLAAFDAAFDTASARSADGINTAEVPREDDSPGGSAPSLAEHTATAYPAAVQQTISTALTRLADYQDANYAKLYLDRLKRIHQLDARHGGEVSNWALSAATAKHLALWMSYEDTIRVADLKTRAERFQRSREEVRASENEVVYLTEFMHPRIEEVADTLPAPLGRWLLGSKRIAGWLDRFVLRERKVQTAKLSGFLMLYTVSSLRRFRRSTLRYATEQQRINDWLNRIEVAAVENYDVGIEIARCQNLVKGYSDTYARGVKNFTRIMDHIDGNASIDAAMVKRLREAALADEHGNQLSEVLEKVA